MSVAGTPDPPFLAHTAVQAVGGGGYTADIDRSWWIIAGPNGGYVAAIVLRAVVAEVADPARRPRSATFHYLRPPAEGPVEVQVTVERSGRSVSYVAARMTQDGRTLVTALVALGVDRDAPAEFDDDSGLPVAADGSALPAPEEVAAGEVDPERDVPMRVALRHAVGAGRPPVPARTRRPGRTWVVGSGWRATWPVDEVVLTAMSDAWLPADLQPPGPAAGRAHRGPDRALPWPARGRTRAGASSSSPARCPATATWWSTACCGTGTDGCWRSPANWPS